MFSRAYIGPLIVSLMLVATTQAQEGDPPTTPPPQQKRPPLVDLTQGVSFEVSPYTGLMGSSGAFGLRLSMNYATLSLELAGEQVIGKTANSYPISLNVLLNLSTKGRLIPYGLVGGGLWITIPTDAIGAETVSTLGLNFGGGARWFISRSFGFRVEAKQYITAPSKSADVQNELLFFQEINVGVTFLLR